MADTASADAGRFIVLDGMRGIAAMVVVVDHVPSATLGTLLPGRYLAVDFFFVLSGFVLSHVYGGRLAKGMPPLSFFLARIIRLYPLYLLATLLGAVMSFLYITKGWSIGTPDKVAPALLFNLAFLPCPPAFTPDPRIPFPFVGPAWSLFFELVVNAVYAFVAVHLSNARLAVFLVIAAPVLAVAIFALGNADGGWSWGNFPVGFARVFFSFFAGVLIYRLRSIWMPPGIPTWLAVAVMILVFMMPATGIWRPAFDSVAAIIVFPILVALSAGSNVRGYSAHVCLTLGLVSYGVYVLQVPIRQIVEIILGSGFRLRPEDLGDFAVVLVFVGSAGVAVIANVFYEAPLRRWLTRISTSRLRFTVGK